MGAAKEQCPQPRKHFRILSHIIFRWKLKKEMQTEMQMFIPARSSSSSHNGTSETSSASPLDIRLHASTVSMQEDHCGASNVDVRRRSSKMTSSKAQPSDPLASESCTRLHVQSCMEKESLSSPKTSKSRRHQFCKVFPDIAETDEVIKSYHCAVVRDILLQGFLYITPNWFCFYSKLLGKKSIKIPVSVVTNITKKKTAIIIPNAIRVITDKDKYVFGSLISRDNTYQLMLNVWQQKRKVLQKDIPVELDSSDINADLDSVTSVGANNTSNASSKDDFVGSSDASFCSDLESTTQSVGYEEHLLDHMSPVPASQRTLSEVAKDASQHSLFRYFAADQPHSSTASDKTNQSIQPKTPVTIINDIVTWIVNFPRTCLFLTISTILVVFLLLCAMLLAYKLINLQVQLATYIGWSYKHDDANENENHGTFEDTYATRHDFHISNVEKIHMILESHVEILHKVNQVLRELQNWALDACTPTLPVVEKS